VETFGVVGGILAAVGVLILLIAGFLIVRTRRFLARSVATQGMVIAYARSSGSEGGSTYRPVVRFTLADGRVSQFADGLATNPPSYAVGAAVPVRYDPFDPEQARIDSRMRLWLVPSILVAVGALLLAIGAVMAFVYVAVPLVALTG
jgi:hypothetical protein